MPESPSFDSWTGFCALLTDGVISSDDQHLVKALERRGWRVDGVDWRTEEPSWPDYDVVLIRSTWNYPDHLREFLDVLRDIDEQHVQLENGVELVRWNSDKRYLRDLEDQGIPVVPTVFVPVTAAADLAARLAEAADRTSGPVVAKPAIGANASGVVCLEPREEGLHQFEELARLAARRSPASAVLLQPLVESVASEGEYSAFYFAGAFSHAVVKRPRRGEFRVQESCGGRTEAVVAEAALVECGEAVLAKLEQLPLYARVDLVRAPQGGFWLMELELIEPSLYLGLGPGAADRFAEAVEANAS